MTGPIKASSMAGMVVISCDAATARDLAEAFSTAHATCAELEDDRPRWFDDVVALHAAAARADIQNGTVPDTVLVPMFNPSSVATSGGEAGVATATADRSAGAPRPRLGAPASLTLVKGVES